MAREKNAVFITVGLSMLIGDIKTSHRLTKSGPNVGIDRTM